MPQCDYCGKTILISKIRKDNRDFCSERCKEAGALLAASRKLPDDLIRRKVGEVHQGTCPQCHGSGPVDVHTSHRVFSAFFATSWASRSHICCRTCATRNQLGDAAFCLLFGWWGIPWGILGTPLQVGRNLVDAATGPDPASPSPELEKLVRLDMVTKEVANKDGVAKDTAAKDYASQPLSTSDASQPSS